MTADFWLLLERMTTNQFKFIKAINMSTESSFIEGTFPDFENKSLPIYPVMVCLNVAYFSSVKVWVCQKWVPSSTTRKNDGTQDRVSLTSGEKRGKYWGNVSVTEFNSTFNSSFFFLPVSLVLFMELPTKFLFSCTHLKMSIHRDTCPDVCFIPFSVSMRHAHLIGTYVWTCFNMHQF